MERPVWPADKKEEEKYRVHLRQVIRDEFGVAVFQSYDTIGDSRLTEKELKPNVTIGNLNKIERVCNIDTIMQK